MLVLPVAASGRSRIRPAEVGFALLVAGCCVAANTLAVAYVEPLSVSHLGPLALAYHDSLRPLILLPFLSLILILAPALRGVGRVSLIVFGGAVGANIASVAFWSAGVPDYIVFRRMDVVANLSDVLIIASSMVVIASILRDLWRRHQVGPFGTGTSAESRRRVAKTRRANLQ